MTATTPNRVQQNSIASRREAALVRLHGEVPEPRRRYLTFAGRNGAKSVPVRGEVLPPPPGTWYAVIALTLAFVMLGLVMVLSASAVTQANIGNSPYAVFQRQAMWAVIGLVGMIMIARLPYRMWQRWTALFGLIAVAAMFIPFVPGFGTSINGARAWIRFAGLSLQPSELLKLVAILGTADYLARHRDAVNDPRRGLWPVAAIAGGGALLCLIQRDLGSAVVLGGIVLGVAWIGGVPILPLTGLATAGAAGAAAFVLTSPSRFDRFTAFLNVEGEKDHLAYQTYQGYLSMASGGLTGSGIGGSNSKMGYLPYAHSDFIFAVIADELGFIGAATILVAFAVFVGFGVQTALAAPDRFGTLVAGGVSVWFALQAIVNVGGVTGLLPVTGLTLPFFSAGGTSLLSCLLGVGLLLSIARRTGVPTNWSPTPAPAK